MITVISRGVVKEEKISEFKALSARLISRSLKEKGCLSFELHQDVKNQQVFTFIEVWHDGESLASQMQSKHFNVIAPLLNALKDGENDIAVYRRII